MRMKMDESFYVNLVGIAGGLALWWSNDVNVAILKSGKHFIDTRASFNEDEEWFMNFIYGLPYVDEKQELPIKVGTFMWSNHRGEDEPILEKLDRILVSLECSRSFPKDIGALDVAIASDHAPIFLFLKGMNKRIKKKDFKFETKWLLEKDCLDKVEESWLQVSNSNGNLCFGRKLNKTRVKLRKWSKLKRRLVKVKEEEMKERIKILQGK
ncbi:hypothetical protein V6N11_008444 [Hibiscus sabdariffa]|uniref:Reverse transcriptase n=1 Tax=Hibiscus sabdariffa TaxID=183260 RepID=A0ABR2P8C4_9ROSI